jgi:hypothetical protein
MSEVPTYRDYRESVSAIADGVEETLAEYADDYDDDVHDIVFEHVDGSQWVIYTGKAILCLYHSDSEPHEWRAFCDIEDGTWTNVITAMAFLCLRQDVNEELRRREVAV